MLKRHSPSKSSIDIENGENVAKKVCIDLTNKITTKTTLACCTSQSCSSGTKMCIKRYFNNAISKPRPKKIFDSPRDKISIKKEIAAPSIEDEENDNSEDVQVIVFDEKYDDPGKWPSSLTQLEIDYIVDKGPIQVVLDNFPIDPRKRCFSEDLYIYKSVKRAWLVYSVEKDAAFCFACKLFSKERNDDLCEQGLRDWRYIRSKLIKHNSTQYHNVAYMDWLDRKSEVMNAKPKIDQNIIEL